MLYFLSFIKSLDCLIMKLLSQLSRIFGGSQSKTRARSDTARKQQSKKPHSERSQSLLGGLKNLASGIRKNFDNFSDDLQRRGSDRSDKSDLSDLSGVLSKETIRTISKSKKEKQKLERELEKLDQKAEKNFKSQNLVTNAFSRLTSLTPEDERKIEDQVNQWMKESSASTPQTSL